MKKFDDYKKEYDSIAALGSALNRKYIVRFDVWVYFKFTEDNNISPANLNQYNEVIESIKDIKLYHIVRQGEKFVFEKMMPTSSR